MSEKRTFNLSSKATKDALAKQNAKKGGQYKQFKMKGRKARLLVLPPVGDKESVIFQAQVHEIWGTKNGKRMVVASAASPMAFDEEDAIAVKGWNLKKKYEDHSNKKFKEFWRSFMPKRKQYVNVIDLDDVEAGPQVYLIPGSVAKTILDELDDVGEDLTSICDLNDGRVLQVKHNGAEGLNREYSSKFLSETASLDLDSKEVEELVNKVYQLSKLQPAFDQSKFDQVEEVLEKAMNKVGVSFDESEDNDDDDDDDSVDEDNDDVDDDEIDTDDDDEPKSKKNSKSTSKKKVEEEEEVFEEDEDEDEPKSKKSAKPASKKKVEEDEDDDIDFDDEEDEKPAKKALRRK